ncbi:MAG: DNA-3-methyladenine glycosylase [Candidatus Saccharibacteria bacterium]|nr:DNA-3-methyladenine glycosylase [Candidatus Saccharibacteria bacterium]
MASQKVNDFSFLSGPAHEVAPRLLGCILEREVNGVTLRAKIVETEAYDQSDAASHSYKGQTPRTAVMFGEPGHLYVYFTYGRHFCCNVVTGPVGHGSAVLIRAVEPIAGISELTNGPAKLCQVLAINQSLNGHDLRNQPLRLIMQEGLSNNEIVQTNRVGITRAQDVPWRFYIRDNPHVSKR